MSKRGFWNSVAILLLGLIVVVLVVGILSFLSKNVGAFLPTSSALSEYNIAFGYTAPTDTTKLWVKCPDPNKIEISDTINKTVTNEKIETLDWELDISNTVKIGALVGTDLYLNSSGLRKLDLLTGECTQVSSQGVNTSAIAVPYGQYIYFAYMTSNYSSYEYITKTYVRKFNTVNNQFVGSWSCSPTSVIGAAPKTDISGFIYDDKFYIYCEDFTGAFDLEKCEFRSVSYPIWGLRPSEFLNGYLYCFHSNSVDQVDLTGAEEKKQYDFPYTSNFNFTAKGISNSAYLFGQAGSLGGNTIQRLNFTSGKLDVLDLIMTVDRKSPIVARLGANFYILGGCSTSSGNTIVEKFTTEFELDKGTLILLTNGKKANEIVLKTDEQGVDYKASISCAYIGNSKGKGESVEVYMYDDELSDWRLIAA